MKKREKIYQQEERGIWSLGLSCIYYLSYVASLREVRYQPHYTERLNVLSQVQGKTENLVQDLSLPLTSHIILGNKVLVPHFFNTIVRG